jgi:serine phosphatase RsbU (regulator of sigma subunit)
MTKTSITSTESFAIRAQRGEAKRVVLWMIVLAGMAILTMARRVAGGIVMRDNELFFPYLGTLLLAIACEAIWLFALRRANRQGSLLAVWLLRAAAMFDLCVPTALLTISAFLSPRGAIPALSAPALLLMPLVVFMSVLRLRPSFTLVIGLATAAIHLLLAIRALLVTSALPEAYPVYLAYSGILAMTAIIGMAITRDVREHVREAAEEAVAHERADRQVNTMQHDLSIAREIQQGLLPTRSPKLPGFEIAGMNRPADQTGGDYYDWQELPDGRLAVVIADVTGHGIGPALVMAVCRAYARSTAPITNDPAALVTRLNELLADDLPADRFITFVVAVLDRDGTVQLISAGHGPTLLYRAASKEVSEFGGDGFPLGISRGEQYGPTTTFSLAEGDVLVLLTDGFFEWTRPGDGEAFGIPRLGAALRDAAGGDAQTIVRSMDQSVCRFCHGSPQADDMTAVVIKRTVTAVASEVRQQVGDGATSVR